MFTFCHLVYFANTCTNFCEASLKFREMRSSPVNLPTAGATVEFLVVDFCKRLGLNYVN
jgi:hypothetical protein